MMYTIYIQFFSDSKDNSYTFQLPQGNLFVIIITFFQVALIHELGHFTFAKLTGAEVLGFGIGFQFGFPFFYVKIPTGNLLKQQKKPIMYGGVIFNILFAVLFLSLLWIVSLSLKNGVSTELGVFTQINQKNTYNLQQYKEAINGMKAEFYKQKFVLDQDNQFQKPIYRNVLPSFGAISIKIDRTGTDLSTSGSDVLLLQTEQHIQNQFVKVLKPVVPYQETLALIELSLKSPIFCQSSSDKELCLLPPKIGNDIQFFVKVVLNGEEQVITTSFQQLEKQEVLDGGNGIKTVRVIQIIASLLIFQAQASLGLAAFSLLPIPKQSDGAMILDEIEQFFTRKIGIFSFVVGGLYRSLCILLFVSMIILLVLKGFGITL
eukprot:EST42666.1 Peptidase family M50 protein [Spironucleus salmonicida]